MVAEDNDGDFLLVDDFLNEVFLQPVIKRMLSFKDIKEMAQVNKFDHDVFLLDLTLHDAQGDDLVKSVLQLFPEIPVIVLTGYADIQYATRSLSIGASDYLIKDELNPTMLYKAILYSMERNKTLLSLKESEKRYMDLFQFSPNAMWVCDPTTDEILDVNEAAEKLYGWNREEFKSLPLREMFISGMDIQDQDLELQSTLKEFKLKMHITKSGKPIWVDVQSNSILYKGKEVNIVVVNDLSLRIQHLNALELQNRKLKDISWAQSHVVRAPVARILGLIQLLKISNPEDQDFHQALGFIYDSATELDTVIAQTVESAKEVKWKDDKDSDSSKS